MSAADTNDIPLFLLRADQEAVVSLAGELFTALFRHYDTNPASRRARLEAVRAFALPVAAILCGPEGEELRGSFLDALQCALATDVPPMLRAYCSNDVIELPAFLRRH